jgi:phage antirepressor YoqD-like protein
MHTTQQPSINHHLEMGTAAKMLGIGRNKLFAVLREYKILTRDGMPTQHMIRDGYFTTECTSYRLPGYSIVRYHIKPIVTAKGMRLIEDIARNAGLIPTH